ncbi:phosphonate metabolism protein/1,5-bisphosphokinase (PRPP-forming) PhnN [Palleronia sp.]|uniref:phosphonate metabolism protein/1,5-bisphosphokinase (PRPP-forming) PhnN n=1 Tax=Palleronia sp. TaxID=1940284 RepID=UPI0035C803B0
MQPGNMETWPSAGADPDQLRGRFIAVIGPSGVGKDSVMAGLLERHPSLVPVRRIITRPAEAGGEDHQPESAEAFRRREAQGDFVLSWRAHKLHYGIPATVLPLLEAGQDILGNLSRGVLGAADRVFPRLEVLSLRADPVTLAKRLAGRKRETPAEIAERLRRAAAPLPSNLRVHEIWNDASLADAVEAASRVLYPPKG